MERMDGFHVAIIMDGNGRWAQRRMMPRPFGHKAGVKTVREIVPACPDLQIRILTLYAFSSDNWKRPKEEVSSLMTLLRKYLEEETATCIEKGIRINAIGRRDRLPTDIVDMIEWAEGRTAQFTRNVLRVAVDYSAKYALLEASRKLTANAGEQDLADEVQRVHNANIIVPPVDLLIRTGGEQRLSDFLLLESAYAELWFTSKFWPDFKKSDLAEAVNAFHGRQRRFGTVIPAEVSA